MWIISMIVTLLVSGFIFILIPTSNVGMYVIPVIVEIAIMGGFIMYQLKTIKDLNK